MAASTQSRTTSWLNSHNFQKSVKEEADDMDAPLDFSSKKRRCSPDEDSMSDGGTSTSSHKRADSPPSMADFNNPRNLLQFPNFFPQLNAGNLSSLAFANHITDSRNKNAKPVRPFKAYPREPMQLPMNLWMLESLKPGIFGADAFSQYKRATEAAMLGRRSGTVTNARMARGKRKVKMVDDLSTSPSVVFPPTQVTSSTLIPAQKLEKSVSPNHVADGSPKSQNGHPDSTAILPSSGQLNGSDRSGSKTPESNMDPQSKTLARSVSDEVKDAAYWERRRKNNEAAKRSRDSRRAKEDEIALRAGYLENENLQLRVQIEALRAENAKFRSMLILN